MLSNTASMITSASRRCVVVERGADQRHALRLFVRRQAAAVDHGLVGAVDVGEPTLERCIVGVEQRHRNAGIRETDGDAAAHGAGADDAGGLDRRRRTSRRASPGTRRVSRSAKNTCTAPRDSTLCLAVVDAARSRTPGLAARRHLRRLAHRLDRNRGRRCDSDRACAPARSCARRSRRWRSPRSTFISPVRRGPLPAASSARA